MTFKHAKFEDSAVMRSLVKVAKEKGWTPEESIKKTASPETDLSVTDNFTQNILKLCTGLRQQGFNKYADELEDKFVVYRMAAATLYDAHNGETGDDLIDTAHPKGSHHLEGIEGNEAVVETILDRHVKMLATIEKKPTGKLGSSNDILNAVKVALGAAPLAVSKSKTSLGAPMVFEPGIGYVEAPAVGAAGQIAGAVGRGAVSLIPGASGVGGVSAAGLGTVIEAAWPITLGLIAGSLIGNGIFKNKFYATELKEAGNNLLSETKDVAQDTTIQSKSMAFRTALDAALTSGDTALALLANPKPEGFKAMETFSSSLQQASQAASDLMTLAREKISPSKLKPGESGQTHWYDNLTLPFSEASAYRDIEISASNFINVAQKANSDARIGINRAMQLGQQAIQEQQAKAGGPVVANLTQKYNTVLSDIKQYAAIVAAKRATTPNASKLLDWLGKAQARVVEQQNEFNKLTTNKDGSSRLNSTTMAQIVPSYAATLDSIIEKLDAFNKKWISS
jgi:hypothetical protein